MTASQTVLTDCLRADIPARVVPLSAVQFGVSLLPLARDQDDDDHEPSSKPKRL